VQARNCGFGGLLGFCLACGPAFVQPTEQDWQAYYPGQGPIPTRLVNESDTPLAIRVKDYTGQILAQVALEPRTSKTVYLRSGPVRASIRLVSAGKSVVSEGQAYHVPAQAVGFEWRFFPPGEYWYADTAPGSLR
jgi:hypothetical protein